MHLYLSLSLSAEGCTCPPTLCPSHFLWCQIPSFDIEMLLSTPLQFSYYCTGLLRLPLLTFGAVCLVLLLTWAATAIRFYSRKSEFQHRNGQRGGSEPLTLPYAIPWFASIFSFITNQGAFLDSIRSRNGRSASICSVRLGPMKSYFVFSASHVQAIFKDPKALSTDQLNRMASIRGFGMTVDDLDRFQENDHTNTDEVESKEKKFTHDPIYQQYLLNQRAVNTLTAKFVETLTETMCVESSPPGGEWEMVNLYEWLKDKMFTASTTALLGSRVLELYPHMARDFWKFDSQFLHLICGIPKIFSPKVHAALEGLLDGGEKWLSEAWASHDWRVDPIEGEDWEPYFGSRFTRAWQQQYGALKISMRGRASLAIGFLFK